MPGYASASTTKVGKTEYPPSRTAFVRLFSFPRKGDIGKGHASHICKDCAKLPPEVKAEQETLNRLFNLPWHLSKAQKSWLKNRTQDRCPEVKAFAQEQYDMRFGHRHQDMQLDDFDDLDEFAEFDVDEDVME